MGAEQKDILIQIQTNLGQSAERIADLTAKVDELKKQEKDLRDKLKQNIEAFGEESDQVRETRKAIAEVEQAKKAYGKEIGEVSRNVQNAIISDVEYNNTLKGQAALLSQLKDQLRAMPLAMDENGNILREQSKEYMELQARIKSLNDQISQQEQAYGQYSRNVGNYANSIADAFGRMGGSFGGAVSGIRSATSALDVMSKTPVIAILGLVCLLLNQLMVALRSSEEGSNRLTEAFSSFRAIGDIVTKVLQGLGNAIAWVAEKMGQLFKAIISRFDALQGVNDIAEERNRLAKEEIELAKQNRDIQIEVAQSELEVSELRAKASDKSKYSAQERLKFLQEALAKEAEISRKNKEMAEKEYDLIKRQNAITKSSKEALDKEAQAKVKALNAGKAYYEMERSMQRQIQSAMKEIADERNAQIKDSLQAQEQALKGYASLVDQIALLTANETEKQEIQIRNNYKKLAIEIRDAVKAGTMSFEEANYYRVILSQRMADELAQIEKDIVTESEQEQRDYAKERAEQMKNDLILAQGNADAEYRIKRAYLERELELEQESAVKRAELERQLDELNAKYNQDRIDRITDFVNQCTDLLTGLNDIMSNMESNRVTEAEQANEEQKASLEKRLKAGLISQKSYDTQVAKLDKELDAQKAEIARKQATRERSLALFQVAINTAQAIAKIWAEVPKADFGVSTGILTAMAVAMGATQAGAILSQPIPKARKGGLVQGASHEAGGVLINTEGGERIVAGNPSRAFPELLNLISYIGKNVPNTGYATRAEGGLFGGAGIDYDLLADKMAQAVQQTPVFLSLTELREAEQNHARIEDLARN